MLHVVHQKVDDEWKEAAVCGRGFTPSQPFQVPKVTGISSMKVSGNLKLIEIEPFQFDAQFTGEKLEYKSTEGVGFGKLKTQHNSPKTFLTAQQPQGQFNLFRKLEIPNDKDIYVIRGRQDQGSESVSWEVVLRYSPPPPPTK